MSRHMMRQELLSGVLVYPIISISGHCHSYSRTVPSLIPEFPSEGSRSPYLLQPFWKSLIPFPAVPKLAPLLHKEDGFFRDSPQSEVLVLKSHGRGVAFCEC